MYRGLILGGLAFAAVFAAERQFGSVRKDIARYNRMREMSGDPPLLAQGATMLRDIIKSYSDSRRGDSRGMLQSLQYDLVRYARIATM